MGSLKHLFFAARLCDRLEASEVHLPLSKAATADLLTVLPNEDDYVFLSLRGDVEYEVVKVRNESGTLLLERGMEGTNAVLHHHGTCVSTVSPLVVAVIKDMICNYECCEGDCPCEGVVAGGWTIPDAYVDKPWEGGIVFAGDLPMTMGISNAPSWMKAKSVNNVLELSGTPHIAGTFTFSVAATNCNGKYVASQTLTVTVRAE